MSMPNQQRHVIGPDGEKLTLQDLPAPGTRRWVPRRKARIVAAVEGGLLSQAEAFERYQITDEEFVQWKKAITKHGLRGLCVTRANRFRTISE